MTDNDDVIDYVIYLASRELDVARGGDKLYPRVFFLLQSLNICSV